MTSPLVTKLAQHWKTQGLKVRSGTPPDRVAQFEATRRVSLPTELREYFLELDGMDPHWPNDHDANGFSFWPLPRVRLASEELTKAGMKPFAGSDQYFAFGDYLNWSWAYGIHLTSDAQQGGRVLLIGKDPPIEVAKSFGEFVDLYLQDSPRLYGQVPA